jgi:acetyltransferase-like isoleucine patch superfamily enzyme
MNKKYFSLLLSPSKLFQEFKRRKLLSVFRDKNLLLGTGVSLSEYQFGNHNYVGNGVSLESTSLGDHTYINANSTLRYCKIGKFCSIGSNVKAGLGIHPTHMISTHPSFYSKNKDFKTFSDQNYFQEYKTITIGNDVWIGENAIIMGGLTIGDGAIIAAGALVTKDVEPYQVVGGIPAKHMKFRFSQKIIEDILNTRWWDLEEEWFEKNHGILRSNDEFFEYFKIDL